MSLRGRTVGASALVADAQFLVVQSGDVPVAIPSDLVRGIREPEEGPQGQAITWLGVAYPLTDLADRFERPRSGWTAETRAILCGVADHGLAFRVDRVLGLTDVDRRQIVPLPPHFSGPERQWIAGLFPHGESVALIPDPGWLIGPKPKEPKPAAMIEPPATAQPAPRSEPDLVEAEEVNLADQLDVEPIESVNDAENAPWADI